MELQLQYQNLNWAPQL